MHAHIPEMTLEETLRYGHLLREDEGGFGGFGGNSGFGGGEGGATGSSGSSGGDGGFGGDGGDGNDRSSRDSISARAFGDDSDWSYGRPSESVISETGFDLGGEYVDNSSVNEWGNYVNANDYLGGIFDRYNEKYNENLMQGMDDVAAQDKAYSDTLTEMKDIEKAKMQKTQATLGDIGKLGMLLDPSMITTVVSLGLGIISQAKERGYDDEALFNDLFERAQQKAEEGQSLTGGDVEEIFGLNPGEGDSWIESGSQKGQEIMDSLPPEEIKQILSGGPTGTTPFSEENSRLSDLYKAIGEPMTGGQLPPAYEQYRQDLLQSRVDELKNVLPEVMAYTREKGIGAVGGISSVYQGLKSGTERKIADTIGQAQLETSAQALDAYTKGRVAEADIALGERGQMLDYLRGIETAKIGAKASTDVAGAQLEAGKYGALGDIVFGIYDRYTR